MKVVLVTANRYFVALATEYTTAKAGNILQRSSLIMLNKILCKLSAKKAELYVSKVVWTLAVIIVGLLLMWGIYSIYNKTVRVGMQQWFEDMFATGDGLIDEANGGEEFTSGGYSKATTP
jgi:hypothetical protein